MKQQTQQLWALLFESNLVQGSVPQASEKRQSPWYVKLVLAFSGWIASLFILVFLGLVLNDIFDNSVAGLFIGAVVIGISFALLRSAKNEFVEHLALAASLAGQALLIFVIYGLVDDDSAWFWMLVALLQILLTVLIPNFIHRVLTTFAATCSFSIFMTRAGLPQLVTGTVLLMIVVSWVNEFRWVRLMSAFRATGYGQILALLLYKGSIMYGFISHDFFSIYDSGEILLPPWVGIVMITGVMLYLVWNILQRYYTEMVEKIPVMALLATLLLCLATYSMPGLSVGIVILLLGYLGSNRILLGLGTTWLLFSISTYYYFLYITLLEKSRVLFFIGITLLIMRWFMLNVLTSKKEAEHA